MSARSRKPPTQPPDRPSLSDEAPTTIYDSGELPARRRPAPVTAKGSAPPERPRKREQQTLHDKPKQAQPAIQAISMKTPDHAAPVQSENPPTPILPRPKLRAVSEVMPVQAPPPQNLGNLAQPYDPKEAKARALREYVVWGCIAVILASAIALAVWFLAR